MTMTRDKIREVFMQHGFTIKEGQTDLKPYVYEAAESLLALAERALEPQGQALPELPEPVQDVRAMFRGEVDSFVAMDIYITGEQAKKYGQECYDAGRASQLALPAGPVPTQQLLEAAYEAATSVHDEDSAPHPHDVGRRYGFDFDKFCAHVLAASPSPAVAQPVADEREIEDEAHDRDNYLAAQTNDDAACAARYRWLRDKNDWYAEPRIDEEDGTKWELVFYTPARIEGPDDDDSLDAAIDAARAALCQPAEEGDKA